MNLWAEEKSRLYDVFFDRIVAEQTQLCYRDLMARNLPEFCESALKNRARQIFSEHNVLKMHSSARFDLDKPAVRRAFQKLVDEIIHCTVFSARELGEILNDAVALQFDVIVRPRTKLPELLFQSSDICSKQDAAVVLAGFGQHRPFVKALIAEIDYWPTARLKKDDLEELATEVENQIYRDEPITAISRDVKMLLDFESIICEAKTIEIRSEIFYGMLDERNLQSYRDGLLADYTQASWRRSEIESALERFLLMGTLQGSLDEASTVHNRDSESHIRATLLEIGAYHRQFPDQLPTSALPKQSHNPGTAGLTGNYLNLPN